MKAADLGSGPGAMAAHLKSMGCEVIAADLTARDFEAGLPHIEIDFNQPDFAASLGHHAFSIVTAIEVIEHVESPIGFLRNIGRLLSPGGIAVVTTPNVDSLPARLKFLIAGNIRTMDEHSAHISPIFFDLLQRQFLPLAGLAATFFAGKSILGDNHIFILEAAS
jgi:2-polyprenyl-3-methyl-5-hydroxy-6-metoxy-1,4-benzoquinol methylase